MWHVDHSDHFKNGTFGVVRGTFGVVRKDPKNWGRGIPGESTERKSGKGKVAYKLQPWTLTAGT